jgi:hypothetical protein
VPTPSSRSDAPFSTAGSKTTGGPAGPLDLHFYVVRPLFCSIGDLIEFVDEIPITALDGNLLQPIKRGDRYRASELIGWGWNLDRVVGEGPESVRMLNSHLFERARIVSNRSLE